MTGAPQKGFYTGAETGRKTKTEFDIYHARRGKIADPLKQWAMAKVSLPFLNRGW
jgi:hypothetical protein